MRIAYRVLLLALAAGAFLAVGCAPAPPAETPAPKHSHEKTHLLLLPSDLKRNSLVFSDDGATFAYVEASGEHAARMVTPRGPHDAHSEIGRPTFAPHTHRLFYWEVEESVAGKHYALNADGLELPTSYAKPGYLSFSDTGNHWAVVGFEAGATSDEVGPFIVFADGVEMGRYRDVGIPAVGRDGHVAYLARANEQTALFIDGVERRTFAASAAPCAVAAVRKLKGPQLAQHHVVRYLSDGSVLLLTRDADGWAVFHDDARLASYPTSSIDPDDDACTTMARLAQGSIRKADDAPVAAWFERLPGEEERWRVVRNGQPVDDAICTAPWRRQPPELSADGTHITYACASKIADENDGVLVVRDGVRYGPYREVWGLALSKNGAHVAYGAADDPTIDRPWAVYVDGEQRTGRSTSVWRPLVSDDGTMLAWEAQNATQPRGILGIDQWTVGSFDAVLWGPELDADDRVSWIIQRGRKVTRVTVPIAAARAGR